MATRLKDAENICAAYLLLPDVAKAEVAHNVLRSLSGPRSYATREALDEIIEKVARRLSG